MSGIALGYSRKSMVRNAVDEISPARQRAAITAEAERHGLVVELFEDAEGHRSGRTEKRPGWLALKSRLDDPGVRAVIVESLSRASRSIRDLFVFVGELEKRHIALISLKENFDTSTAMGRAFLGVIAILNQFESDVASERMKMTISYRRATHKIHFGLAPFGTTYRKTDHSLIASSEGIWRCGTHIAVGSADANPFIASTDVQWFGYMDAVHACFEIYARNQTGFVDCSDKLNELGYMYRNRNGLPRPFESNDVRRMIAAAPLYAGHITNGRAKDALGVVIESAHDPIIDPVLCDRLIQVHQARHGKFSRSGSGGRAKRVYLIADLYCAECGAHMKGEFQKGRRYYRHVYTKKKCNQTLYVRADVVEQQVIARLEQFEAPREMKERIKAKARALAEKSVNPEWKAARAVIDRVEAKLARLHELYIDGEISKPDFVARKTKLEEQIAESQTHLHDAPIDVKELELLLTQIDHIAGIIANGEPARQREVIASLFERYETREGKITLARLREWARPFFNGDLDEIEKGTSSGTAFQKSLAALEKGIPSSTVT